MGLSRGHYQKRIKTFCWCLRVSIVERVSQQQLRWLGHVWRMSDEAPPKKIAQIRPEGSRRRGRQRLMWLDCLEEDLTSRGITNWTAETADREKWRQILSRLRIDYGSENHCMYVCKS